MNVTSIGFYNQSNSNRKFIGKKKFTDNYPSPIVNKQYNISYISFSGSLITQLMTGELKFRNLLHIPCACCGREMVPGSEIALLEKNEPVERSIGEFLNAISEHYRLVKNDPLEQIAKKDPNISVTSAMESLCVEQLPEELQKYQYKNRTPLAYTKKTISTIQKYENSLFSIEKNVFEKIKALHAQYQDKTLPELMAILRPPHLENLIATQLGILYEIESMANGLSTTSKEMVLGVINSARSSIITDSHHEEPFKRKTFLNQIYSIKTKLSEGIINPTEDKLMNLIKNKAFSLPTSNNDSDAFIVKYSGLTQVQEHGTTKYKARSAREIGQRLLARSVSTIEHVKPKSQGGESSPINYILECADCNNNRHHTHLDKWARLRPEMGRNCQRQIDFVIDGIRRDVAELRGYSWYPEQIARTLKEESRGAIELKISELEHGHSFLPV